jgi:hypothetical protein
VDAADLEDLMVWDLLQNTGHKIIMTFKSSYNIPKKPKSWKNIKTEISSWVQDSECNDSHME